MFSVRKTLILANSMCGISRASSRTHWWIPTASRTPDHGDLLRMVYSISSVFYGIHHRGRTYIESDRMTSSAPIESADQTARAGGRVSTTMVVLARPPMQSDQLNQLAPMMSSCRSLYMSFLYGPIHWEIRYIEWNREFWSSFWRQL